MDKIFNKPFAVNGARVAIPENGTESERVSFDKGFTQPYEVEAPSVDNPAGQGFNILRPEMNEALYQLSSACNFLAENIDNWIALTNENLNNITQKGRYFQAVQSQAINANSYPVNETGYLIVFDSINNNVTQFYKSAITSKTFYRYKIGSVWGEWIENLTTDNAYRKNEVYTKNETNNLMVAGGYSRNGYTASNIANATIPIPNKSVITGCCIMITGIYNMGTNGHLDTDFIFKIDDVEIGRVNLHKNGQSGSGTGTYHLINQESFNLSGKLGKTIIPSISQNQGSITSFNFLVVWQ